MFNPNRIFIINVYFTPVTVVNQGEKIVEDKLWYGHQCNVWICNMPEPGKFL